MLTEIDVKTRVKALSAEYPDSANALVSVCGLYLAVPALEASELPAYIDDLWTTYSPEMEDEEDRDFIQEILNNIEPDLTDDWGVPERVYDRSISVLCLSQRIKDILVRENLDTIRALTQKTWADLREIEGIGEQRVQDIDDALSYQYPCLGMEFE